MDAFAAFLSSWTRTRAVFGDGPPSRGSHFEASGQLRHLQVAVENAGPGAQWQGPAASAYDVKNGRQGATLRELAELDARFAAEIDRSAAVVTAGRRDLDAVRQWVTDAAATIPRTGMGDHMLWPLISKGSGQVASVVTRSHQDLTAVARRIRELEDGYRGVRPPFPRSPTDGTNPQAPDPQDVAQWYMDWEDLQSRIDRHNAVYPRPPVNTPAGIAYQAEKEELDIEQAKLVVEAANLGITVSATETE